MISNKIEPSHLESIIEMRFSKVKRSRSLENLNKPLNEIEANSKLESKKEQNESFKRIKILIKETLYNSLAQAIIKIIETPIFTLKMFLFLCVILSSGVCSYLIIELIVTFFSYDVTTKSRTFYETPALFPKITICNINPFTTKHAVEFLKQVNKDLIPKIDIFNDEQMSQFDYETRLAYINRITFRAINKMNVINETEKRKLSRSFEEIFFDSNPNDFSWYFDPWYGNCWIYNSGLNISNDRVPLVTKNVPGETNALWLNFYVNFYQNLTKINANGYGLGAFIRIENSSYLTNPLHGDGIKIQPGLQTSLSLRRSFKTNLPQPYSNCLIDNETNAGFHSALFDLIQNSEYRYTQSMCYLQCLQRALLEICDCTDAVKVSLLPNASKCSKNHEIKCFLNLDINERDFYKENCSSECPLECYLDSFDVSLSSYELIPELYKEFLNSEFTNLANDFPSTQQIDEETARKSFIELSIFYKSLSYETSTESPQMNGITLISNIASNLSLFLGVSVFSLFEPLQVLIEIIYIKLKKN